jgi:hypothetical protein
MLSGIINSKRNTNIETTLNNLQADTWTAIPKGILSKINFYNILDNNNQSIKQGLEIRRNPATQDIEIRSLKNIAGLTFELQGTV